jgi:hypothetical protein
MSSSDEQIWAGSVSVPQWIYLKDYSMAARIKDVSSIIKTFEFPCMTPGIVDALLDSVN